MLFSVVIPTHNRVHFLASALETVWQQRFPAFEVIVVDDGSNDGTKEYLRNLGTKLRVITQANSGPGAARNAGVRAARGDYVAFLDDDDLWFPWTLEVFASVIQEHRRPHIVGGNFVEFTDETELLNIGEEACETAWFADYIASSQYPYFVGSGTCVLHRETVAEKKFLEDRLNAEDHDLIMRMGTLPGFVRIRAPITLGWRRHPASETRDLTSIVIGHPAAAGAREGRRLSWRVRTFPGTEEDPCPLHATSDAWLFATGISARGVEALWRQFCLERNAGARAVSRGVSSAGNHFTFSPSQAASCGG